MASLAAFASPPFGGVPLEERGVIRDFIVGYAALWVILTAGAENDSTADAASALAVSIAFAATVLYLATAATNVGVLSAQKGA